MMLSRMKKAKSSCMQLMIFPDCIVYLLPITHLPLCIYGPVAGLSMVSYARLMVAQRQPLTVRRLRRLEVGRFERERED